MTDTQATAQPTKTCPACGRDFVAVRTTQKFCPREAGRISCRHLFNNRLRPPGGSHATVEETGLARLKRCAQEIVRDGAQHHAFWRHVEKSEGCWEWTSYRAPKGYGRASYRDIGVAAHRLSYEINVGPIPDGLMVCHKCDNPPCVRPDHLFLGTNAENQRDASRKGRLKGRHAGELHPTARLTERDVLAIRRSRDPIRVIAQTYGIARSTVTSVRSGRSWKHLTDLGGE